MASRHDSAQFDPPDGTYANGRVLRDASVAFYKGRSDDPARPPIGDREFEFVVGAYDDEADARSLSSAV